MRIEPRRNLLDIWRAFANYSYRDNKWQWGGRNQSNSVSDAQQVLCLLFPAVALDGFSISIPDETDRAVLAELKNLGSAMEIPQLLVKVLHDYLDRYTLDETPVFSGGTYFQSADPQSVPTTEQQNLDVVESYATSLTLMLATLDFATDFRRAATREEVRVEVDRLRERASKRLTAAMVGLLRSFTINTFDADSVPGRALLRTVNQSGMPERRVIEELRESLAGVIAALGDVNLGSGQGKDLSGSTRLFECGWSWGVIDGTDPIEFADAAGKQQPGVASDEPYLYFTMMALNSIADLFTAQSLRTDLLDVQQIRLARALQNRWNTTQLYWSILADFGGGPRWPLEDVPWRATDEIESDYLTILVAGTAMRNLIDRKALDPDIERLGQVLVDLSNRARITRRPMAGDESALALHHPGLELDLVATGQIEGPQLQWPIHDYAAVLLKRAVRVASLFQANEPHTGMLLLSDQLWQHLQGRRIMNGPATNLWDSPGRSFPHLPKFDDPSWQMTVRVVECLVIAAEMIHGDLLRSDRLRRLANDLLVEADRLLDRELLSGASHSGPAVRRTIDLVAASLQRAREIIDARPGGAIVLIQDALLELEKLLAAREQPTWAR